MHVEYLPSRQTSLMVPSFLGRCATRPEHSAYAALANADINAANTSELMAFCNLLMVTEVLPSRSEPVGSHRVITC